MIQPEGEGACFRDSRLVTRVRCRCYDGELEEGTYLTALEERDLMTGASLLS